MHFQFISLNMYIHTYDVRYDYRLYYSIHYIDYTRVCVRVLLLIGLSVVSTLYTYKILQICFSSDDRQTPLRLIARIAEASQSFAGYSPK